MRHHDMRQIVALLTFILAGSPSAYATESKIDGFAGYRFGMTINDAKAVRADAELTDCEFRGVWRCLEFPNEFYGEQARVVVQLDSKTRLVDQIVVQFDRLNTEAPEACSLVIQNVVPQLEAKYGKPSLVKSRQATWYFPQGGKVSFHNLCIDKDNGTVAVSYSAASPL